MEEIPKTTRNSIAERLPKSHKMKLKFAMTRGAQTTSPSKWLCIASHLLMAGDAALLFLLKILFKSLQYWDICDYSKKCAPQQRRLCKTEDQRCPLYTEGPRKPTQCYKGLSAERRACSVWPLSSEQIHQDREKNLIP